MATDLVTAASQTLSETARTVMKENRKETLGWEVNQVQAFGPEEQLRIGREHLEAARVGCFWCLQWRGAMTDTGLAERDTR
eukprot:1883896-Amphidinium_carterae.1